MQGMGAGERYEEGGARLISRIARMRWLTHGNHHVGVLYCTASTLRINMQRATRAGDLTRTSVQSPHLPALET